MPRLVGLALESAGTEVARDFEIESPIGAVIARVAPGSAGEKAGLKPGDLVTTFGESEINDVEDLEARLLTSPVGSLQKIRVSRASAQMSIDTELEIRAGLGTGSALASYVHPQGGWALGLPPFWKVDPYARRDSETDRVYDQIRSTRGNYEWRVYHESQPAGNEAAAFIRFVTAAQKRLGQFELGQVKVGKIPVVFVAGTIEEETRHMLFRLALIVEGQRYDIDVLAPPLTAPDELPFVIGAVLGTLKN
jgi:membrane-associated protease RseP (regulator of RpoE activity)